MVGINKTKQLVWTQERIHVCSSTYRKMTTEQLVGSRYVNEKSLLQYMMNCTNIKTRHVVDIDQMILTSIA